MAELPSPIQPANSQAKAFDRVEFEKSQSQRFIPSQSYPYDPKFTTGTPQNQELLNKFADNEYTATIALDSAKAFEYKAAFGDKMARWQSGLDALNKSFDATATAGMDISGVNAKIEAYQKTKPVMNPYVAYLTSQGDTPNQIATNLTKNNDKAQWYFKKYSALGIENLIRMNAKYADDPEGLADIMRINGYFDPNTDEESFFRSAAQNKYSVYFGHSTYAKLRSTYDEAFSSAGFHISSLPFQIQAGRKLSIAREQDKKDMIDYWDWSRSQKGQSWFTNAISGARHVGESFCKTLFEAGIGAIGDNEFSWSPKWEQPKTAEDIALKQKFLAQWKECNEIYRSGKAGDNSKLFAKFRKLQDKEARKPLSDDLAFDIQDPSEQEDFPEKIKSLAESYRELNKRDAFRTDLYGLSQTLGFIDGALQMTAGWGHLLVSSDPDSLFSSILSPALGTDLSEMEKLREIGSSPWSKTKYAFRLSGGEKSMSDEELSQRMQYFQNACRFEKGMEHWKESGLFPEFAYDHDMAEAAAGWADISLLAGIGRKAATSLFAESGGKAIERFAFAGKLERRFAAMSSNAEALMQKGVSLPQELRSAIDTLKRNAKDAGIPISDADAIRKIYAGEPSVLDPATGTLIPMSKDSLVAISKTVGDKLDAIKSVRSELARLAVAGRNVQYAEGTMRTMDKIKEWLINNETASKVKWSEVPTSDIYQHVLLGDIQIPNNIVSSTEMTAMKNDVGSMWRKIDRHSLNGYERTGRLPVEFAYDARDLAWRGLANMMKGVGKSSERYYDIGRTYGTGNEAATSVTARALNKATTESGVGVEQSPAFRIWAIGHIMPKIGQFIGFGGRQFEHYLDYCKYESKLGGNSQYGSALKTMQKDTLDEITRITAMIDEATANPAFKTEAEIKALTTRRGQLVDRWNWAKKADVFVGDGIIAGGISVLKNGTVHGLYNEALAYAADTRNPGSMFGATYGLTGVNKVIHTGMVLKLDESTAIERRSNFSLNEFTSHISEIDDLNHRRRWIEAVMDITKKSKEISIAKGNDVGKRFFATSIEAMNGLFRSKANIVLGDEGYIDGVHSIISNRALAQHPEYARGLKDQFLKEAFQYGLTGAEAENHAVEKVNAILTTLAGQSRRAQLSDHVERIRTAIADLNEDANKHQSSLEEAAKQIQTELGINPNNVQIDPTGATTKVVIDGVEMPENETTYSLRSRIIAKVQALQELKAQVRAKRAETFASIEKLKQEEQRSSDEMLAIGQANPVHEFRPGEVFQDSGNRFTTYKDGITIWEKQDENGNTVKTQVILDRKKLNIETMWEETMHALTFSENMHKGRVMLNRALFGNWEIDPNDKSKLIQQYTNPITGVAQEAKPLIGGDIETNIDFLRMFADSYSNGLEPSEKALFMAQFDSGVDRFMKNHLDVEGLQPLMNELLGKIYIQRQALSGPFSSRGAWSPSSAQGSAEFGPNTAGVSTARLWAKLIHGDLGIEDMVLQGRNLNIDELGLGQDGKETPEQNYLQERIIAAGKFLQLFGRGGDFDRMIQQMNVDRAKSLGFDPQWFGTQKMYDSQGNVIDMPEEFTMVGNVLKNESRGWGSPIRPFDVFNDEKIEKNQNSDKPEDVADRVKWALSTGRKDWLTKAGKFKADIWQLYVEENAPITEFFRHATVNLDNCNKLWGLTLQRIKNGGYCLVGTPTVEQSKNIKAFFENYAGTKKYNSITWANISNFIESISAGNAFDPKAPSPGQLQVFSANYRHIWSSEKETGSRRYEPGDSRQMNFVPFALVIMDTTFNAEGKNYSRKWDAEERKFVVTKVKGPQVFAWSFDVDNMQARMQAGMRGQPIDGKILFKKGELLAMFNGDFNLFYQAVRAVQANLSVAGSLDPSAKEYAIPEARSWEALLPLADGSKPRAQLMAMAINRIIGFPSTNFQELTLLEKEVIQKKSNGVPLSEAELKEKKAKLAELRAKEDGNHSANDIERAKLGAKLGRNTLGDTPGYDDPNSTFMLIRPDRIRGVAQRVVDGNGNPVNIYMSNWGNQLGGINYSASNWNPLSESGLDIELKGWNTEGAKIYQGWTHKSGYKAFLMQSRDEKGQLSKKTYVVFDSQRNIVNKGVLIKDLDTAFQVAAQHSEQNPQLPAQGNLRENAMFDAGWQPKGIDTQAGLRTRWVSSDQEWLLKRNENGSAFDLVHIKSGFTIAKNLSLNDPIKKDSVSLGDVNAAIMDAVENNTIHVLTKKEEHKQLEQLGLAEWHMVPSINEKGLLQNKKQLYATDNMLYYDFKRMLAYGPTGKPGQATIGFGPEYARRVTEQMKKDLGFDVIANDKKAVMDWIEKWHKQFDPMEIVRDVESDLFRERLVKWHEQQQFFRDNYGTGKPLDWGKPVAPDEKDYRHKTTGDLDVDAFNAAKARYAREIEVQEAAQRRAKGISYEQVQQMGEADLAVQIQIMRAELNKQLAEANKPVKPQLQNFEADNLIEKIGKLTRFGLEAREKARSTWLSNRAGYLIQSLMYGDETPQLGIEATIGRIGFASSRLTDSTAGMKNAAWWVQGPSKLSKNTFILYSPGGQMLGKYESIEKAQEASFNDHLTRESIKAQQGLKNVSGDTEATKNPYEKYNKK